MMKDNEEDGSFREKTKTLFTNYDEALLGIETVLGTVGKITEYLIATREQEKIPVDVQYCMANITILILAYAKGAEFLGNLKKIDLSHIEDCEMKLDIALDYLEEVIQERKNKREKK